VSKNEKKAPDWGGRCQGEGFLIAGRDGEGGEETHRPRIKPPSFFRRMVKGVDPKFDTLEDGPLMA